MVQRDVDPLTGARRDDVLISADDLRALRLRGRRRGRADARRAASFRGRLKAAPIKPGNLEVHWPEGNALLSASAIDPESMEPDYNAHGHARSRSMRQPRTASAVVALLCPLCPCFRVLGGAAAHRRRAASIDAAFQRFWAARDPQEAAKAAQDVDRVRRLVRRRARPPEERAVPTRRRSSAAPSTQLQRRSVTGDFFYQLVVPETYDPARKYQVRVQLHGGVMMRETGDPRGRGGRGGRGGGPLEGAEQIYVLPSGWRDAPWWSRAQVENLDAILDAVKRTYNVDENRVVLSGVSTAPPACTTSRCATRRRSRASCR